MFFSVMVTPLEYVRPELFDEAVDRHHRSYVLAVLGGPLGMIRCSTTRTVDMDTPAVDSEVRNSYLLFIFVSLL
jgi:hypothetical protein